VESDLPVSGRVCRDTILADVLGLWRPETGDSLLVGLPGRFRVYFHGAQAPVSETVGIQADNMVQSQDAPAVLWSMTDKNAFPGNMLSGAWSAQMFPEQLLVVLFCGR